MTISLQQNGATRSSPKALTTTSATDIFTAPKFGALLSTVNIANTTGGAVTTTLAWYRASDTTAYAVRSGFSLAANAREQIDLPIEMAEGDKLQATAGTGNALVVIATWVARTGPMTP